MCNGFKDNAFGRFFLGQNCFSLIVKSISEFIFGKSVYACGSKFPTGFRKFRLPDLSSFRLGFLLAVVLISHVFWVFHKLSFNFTGLIGGDVSWFSHHSSVIIEYPFLFRILFFFNIFV